MQVVLVSLVVIIPVVVQRPIPMVLTVQQTIETPQLLLNTEFGHCLWRRVPSTKWHACVRWQKCGNPILGGIMDSLTREEFDAFIPTGEAVR